MKTFCRAKTMPIRQSLVPFLLTCGMVTIFPYYHYAAQSPKPLAIDFTPRLHCIEDTDEVGADEPYAIIFAANLRTARTRVTAHTK